MKITHENYTCDNRTIQLCTEGSWLIPLWFVLLSFRCTLVIGVDTRLSFYLRPQKELLSNPCSRLFFLRLPLRFLGRNLQSVMTMTMSSLFLNGSKTIWRTQNYPLSGKCPFSHRLIFVSHQLNHSAHQLLTPQSITNSLTSLFTHLFNHSFMHSTIHSFSLLLMMIPNFGWT